MKEKLLMFRDEDDGCNPEGKDNFSMKISIEWEYTDFVAALFDEYYDKLKLWWNIKRETHEIMPEGFEEAVLTLFAMEQSILLPDLKELENFRQKVSEDFDVAFLQRIDMLMIHVLKNTCRNMSETIRRLRNAIEMGVQNMALINGGD